MKKAISILLAITVFLVSGKSVLVAEAREQADRVFEVDESAEWLSVYADELWVLTYHLKDEFSGKEEEFDFYDFFFSDQKEWNNAPYRIYNDCSWSMQNTFSYEKNIIKSNMSKCFEYPDTEVKDIFKKGKTDLYPILNEYAGNFNIWEEQKEEPYIGVFITDLWNTKEGEIERQLTYQVDPIFCVPYRSTDKEAVLHCEEFAKELILGENSWWESEVWIVYMDEVIVRYDNHTSQFDYGVMVYVP